MTAPGCLSSCSMFVTIPIVTNAKMEKEIVMFRTEDLLKRNLECVKAGLALDAEDVECHRILCEFGMIGQTMHKADERAALSDLKDLTEIYRRILTGGSVGEQYGQGFFLHDEDTGLRLIEKARALGVRNICIHKEMHHPFFKRRFMSVTPQHIY